MPRGRRRIQRDDPYRERRRVTHCPKGHEFTPENSYVNPRTGSRQCRACQYEWSKRGFRRDLYGLSLAQYEDLLRQQSGRCAICGTDRNGGVAMGVDHDHRTGDIRGLLCDPCNIGLGGFRDDPALLAAASAYLQAKRPSLPEAASGPVTFGCGTCGADAGPEPHRPVLAGRSTPVCLRCWSVLRPEHARAKSR